MSASRRWIVALPAKNEVQRIEGALAALDHAAACSAFDVNVLVFANNCSDTTAQAADYALRHCPHLSAIVTVGKLPTGLAHAGGARLTAVRQALRCFGGEAVDMLLTTDADSRVRPDLFARMEHAFYRGADVVLAKIECIDDPFEPACKRALAWGAMRAKWRHRVRQLVETVRTGTIPHPPLHDDYGAAGIAATVNAYRQLGGFRPIQNNEDLQFVRAADTAGLHVDRQSGATVDVLARTVGRAAGGMAEDIANCTRAVANGVACMVENHRLTTRRITRHPSHASAFATTITDWELAEEAIQGLDRAIANFSSGDRRAWQDSK